LGRYRASASSVASLRLFLNSSPARCSCAVCARSEVQAPLSARAVVEFHAPIEMVAFVLLFSGIATELPLARVWELETLWDTAGHNLVQYMNPTTRVSLVKILPKQYAEDFLDGNLYLNPASYFSSIDKSDAERFDANEAVLEAWQTKKIEIFDDKTRSWLEIGGVQNPAILRDGSHDHLNLLCVYAMTDRDGDDFDPRNQGFGDTAIFIRDLSQFIARMRTAASAQSKRLAHGPVEYVDRATYHGRMGTFRKFSEFQHQNEFRFVINGGDRTPCRLNVGDVRDITFVAPSSEIPVQWRILRSLK